MSRAATASLFLRPRVARKMHDTVRSQDRVAFFQQLTTLFRAGTPLLEALQIAAGQTQSRRLAEIIRDVAGKVAAGAPLHEALAAHPAQFRREWVEVVRSGEDSGQLGDVLEALAAQIDSAAELSSKLRTAMMYPAIVLVVAVLALVVMLVEVVPTFASMFDSFGKELPAITQTVLDVSDFVRDSFFLLAGGIAAGIVLARRWVRTPGGRRSYHALLISLPVLGEAAVQANMQRFAINLRLLLRAGLPLHDAIRSLQGIFESNVVYRDSLETVGATIATGGTLAGGLEATGVFTTFASRMVRIGEESGTLVDVLGQLDDYYKRKVEAFVARAASLLETITILGMGVTVAVILCAIYLPLFSMASGV